MKMKFLMMNIHLVLKKVKRYLKLINILNKQNLIADFSLEKETNKISEDKINYLTKLLDEIMNKVCDLE